MLGSEPIFVLRAGNARGIATPRCHRGGVPWSKRGVPCGENSGFDPEELEGFGPNLVQLPLRM